MIKVGHQFLVLFWTAVKQDAILMIARCMLYVTLKLCCIYVVWSVSFTVTL